MTRQTVSKDCCETLEALKAYPFSQCIVLDFWDYYALTGVLTCTCSQCFLFWPVFDLGEKHQSFRYHMTRLKDSEIHELSLALGQRIDTGQWHETKMANGSKDESSQLFHNSERLIELLEGLKRQEFVVTTANIGESIMTISQTQIRDH